jgi:CRISPR-associated protein Cmr2
MSYLFLVHLGPVQDFIASARRSRDLAFGSWFLSEISRVAAYTLRAQQGLLIFPAPEQERLLEPYTWEFTIANKILALMEKPPQDYGKDGLGQLVYEAIMDQLGDFKKKAYMGIQLSPENLATAERQIRNLVEFLWVALPYDEKDTANYAPTRLHLEALMAARKNTRDFPQMRGAYVPKSSIDGRLESVIPENEFPDNRASEQQRLAKVRQLYWKYGAGPAERLSGVDLLKRHGLTAWNITFPGTGHIAALPFLRRLSQLDTQAQALAREKWLEYIEKVKQIGKPRYDESAQPDENTQPTASLVIEKEYTLGDAHPILQRYDGTMLFEERLVDLVGPTVDQEKMKEAKKALQAFYQFTDGQFARPGWNKARPDPYYALLQADGDSMGDVIDAQAKYGYERHRQLSQRLASFAGRVDSIVRKYRGAPVYAGGDDILAFLPLDTALACASELSRQFHGHMRGFVSDEGRSPTLSIGIAIVHYLDSLRLARSLASDAEQRAKQVEGKNALAITVSKRSGEDYSLAGKWNVINDHVEQMIMLYRQDAIPVGTAYELRDMLLRLTTTVNSSSSAEEQTRQLKLIETLPKVMRWDALRIMRRKLFVPRGKFSQEQAEAIEQSFKVRLGIKDETQNQSGQEITPLSQKEAIQQYQRTIEDLTLFINELIIAQVFADARQMAQPEKEKKGHDHLDH